MKKLLLPLLFAAFLTQICVNNAMDDERPGTLPRALSNSEEQLISAGNDFSVEIFRRVTAGEDDKNVFISSGAHQRYHLIYGHDEKSGQLS